MPTNASFFYMGVETGNNGVCQGHSIGKSGFSMPTAVVDAYE
jgi:hypothetical protein